MEKFKITADSTWCSQVVTHPSTNHAQRCLTAVIEREPVLATWYGRWQEAKTKIRKYVNYYNMQKALLISLSIYDLITYQCSFIFWSNIIQFISKIGTVRDVHRFIPLSPEFRRYPKSKCVLKSISSGKTSHLLQLSVLSFFRLVVVEISTLHVIKDLLQDNKFYNPDRRMNIIIQYL